MSILSSEQVTDFDGPLSDSRSSVVSGESNDLSFSSLRSRYQQLKVNRTSQAFDRFSQSRYHDIAEQHEDLKRHYKEELGKR